MKEENALLESLYEAQKEQLDIHKKQLLHSRIITGLLLILCLTIAASAVAIVPRMSSILTNLHEISQEINDQDPIDVENLNTAIEELRNVLTPLSELLNFTGRLGDSRSESVFP